MSRIGKLPVVVPDKVQVKIDGRILTAKGPLGELQHRIPEDIDYTFENNTITFSRNSDEKNVRALHGLCRALASNTVEGVSKGFEKTLKIEGVGYKAEVKGKYLLLTMGYSHPIMFIPPEGISFEIPGVNTIRIKGIDKQLVGQIAAKVRKVRPPEPYKGKGIRYEGEYIRRKAGKTASK